MKDILDDWKWPVQRINFNDDLERACPHGVGHGGIHGCDGCCGHPSYREATSDGLKKFIKKHKKEKRKKRETK